MSRVSHPVTGGNVSFYNQSKQHAIRATPIVGMIGKVDDIDLIPSAGFEKVGDCVAIIGMGPAEGPTSSQEPTESAFQETEADASTLESPVDTRLDGYVRTNACLLRLLQQRALRSCRAVTGGGLWRSLAKSAFHRGNGAILQGLSSQDVFAEGGHRFLVSFEAAQAPRIQEECQNARVPFQQLGHIEGNELQLQGLFSFSVEGLHREWSQTLEQVMDEESLAPESSDLSPKPVSLTTSSSEKIGLGGSAIKKDAFQSSPHFAFPPEQAECTVFLEEFSPEAVRGKRILVMGSGRGSNFEALVPFVREWGVEVAGLFCDRPRALILERAKRLQVPVTTVSKSVNRNPQQRTQAVLDFLQQPFDCLVLAGYMRILAPEVVQRYSPNIINIHPSILPAYPGLHAIRRTFEGGDLRAGVTVHVVTEAVDVGPILAQAHFAREVEETLASLEERIHILEHWLYPRVILFYLSR